MLGLARRARFAGWIVGLLPLLAASKAGGANDADIYALIDALKPVAESITVDGDPSDWGAIPAFADPTGDAGGDASRDVTSVRIAPTASALNVLIQTAGAPSTAGYAFWIQFDFMGDSAPDVELALDTVGPDGLTYFEETGCSNPSGCSMDWDQSAIAIGSAVEIRVPYAQLDAVLPPSMQGKLTGSGARSWVRVWVHTIAYQPGYTEIDHGSTVASFRLVTTPYPLDPALPSGGDSFTALPSPLFGLWFIGQGAMTHGTHAGIWAYDLHRTDNSLHPENPVGSQILTNDYSYGQAILAPASGTVLSLENGQPDDTPYGSGPIGSPNFVFLGISGNLGLLFSHAKPGSVRPALNASVAAGGLLAQVGMSGTYGWPHLHYEARDLSSNQSQPLGFANCQLGLNPYPSDPWRRSIASWGIREGFFVLPEPRFAASISAGVAALALGHALRARRRCKPASSAAEATSPSVSLGSGRSVPS